MKRKLNYESDEENVCATVNLNTDIEYNKKLFEPVHFLRCHSKKNDPADVQTQVWQCAFEPDMDYPGCNTSIVATCGGNSVCFIDVVTGDVVSKFYSEKPSILLYSLAWTTLTPGDGRRCNILAVGGSMCYLQLLLPGKKCSLFASPQYLKPPSTGKKKEIISFITFHPSKRNILFCCGSSGHIAAWDIGECHPWGKSSEPKSPQLLFSMSAHSEVFSMTISPSSNFLLSGCNSGVFGWSLDDYTKVAVHGRVLSCIEFELPEIDSEVVSNMTNSEETLVDSIICIPGSSLVATKPALRGVIYIWNLEETLSNMNLSSIETLGYKGAKLKINPIRVLRWSDSDDYFMSMGCTPDGKLLACGDDEGGIWMYNLDIDLKKQKSKRPRVDVMQGLHQEPWQRLIWPSNLEDVEVQNARKIKSLEGNGGVIDQVSLGIGQNGSVYLTAVTCTNLVCIWRSFDEDDLPNPEFIK